jgi:hypothetical protein
LIHSVARRPSLNWMAASDVNLDATIRASIADSDGMGQLCLIPCQTTIVDEFVQHRIKQVV